jgi:hypothetical protein
MTPENIEKFWISVGIPLVPPDHPIYQDRSWRVSFVSRPHGVDERKQDVDPNMESSPRTTCVRRAQGARGW